MEEQCLAEIHQAYSQDHNLPTKILNLALSLITNPFTSYSTLSSLLDTLTICLQNPASDHTNHHHVLSLVSSLSHHHPHFCHHIIATVRAFIYLPSTPSSSLLYALSFLLSVNTKLNFPPGSTKTNDPLADENLFLSLCFGQSVAARCMLLRNVSKFCVRPSVLLPVLLGFTRDPYPNIREVALDDLVQLSNCIMVGDQSLIESCYFRAVELLLDCDDPVRRSAVRAVSEWGKLLVACNQDQSKKEWSDAVFIQLCSMVRDMDMKIRVVAFDALGKIRMVSEDILLQTLSKKTLPKIKEDRYYGQFTAKLLKISGAAFAFVHGLEDEFHEVRRSACRSLCMLTAFSAEFARQAVNILMDMLNDDSVVVRLQALETIRYMAISDHLKVEETLLRRFLGTLLDRNDSIRSAARNTLQSMKLQNLAMFRLGLNSLMKNLEFYPQDEADLFFILFKLGRTHGKFVGSIIRDVFHELEPSLEGKLGFDNARTVALLVLAISVPVSFERQICTVPPQIFSYAVTELGRISRALSDVANQNSLLAYLSHCSRFSVVSVSEFFKGEEPALQLEQSDFLLCQKSNKIAEAHLTSLLLDYLPNLHDRVTSCVKNVLRKISDIWRLIELGCMGEVIQTLR